MSSPVELNLRIIAERESDSRTWSFYLVNDGASAIDTCELAAVRYEWGDQYVGGEAPSVRLVNVSPGAHLRIWHDDGSSEMRTDLWLCATHQRQQAWLLFEFPRLYQQKATTLVAHPTVVQGPPARIL